MSISALENLSNEFGSKLMELDCDFVEMTLTVKLLDKYVKAGVIDHIDAQYDEESELFEMVAFYGVGNYKEAELDLLEFKATFN